MRKIALMFFFSIILLLSNFDSLSGQETNHTQLNIWSVSLSYAPIETFYYYPKSLDIYEKYSPKGISEDLYPIGFNFRLNRTLIKRLSLSAGFNYKAHHKDNKIDVLSESFGTAYFERSTDNMYIFEIPLDINYHIFMSPKLVDPFFKTGLRNSYFKRSYTGEYLRADFEGSNSGEINNHQGTFLMFYELGAGTYLNLLRSVSIMVESNLTSTLSGLGCLELQAGLKYSF